MNTTSPQLLARLSLSLKLANSVSSPSHSIENILQTFSILHCIDTTNNNCDRDYFTFWKMSSEKFCLKWNDFETNISGAFRELRDDSDFFDVTLACDDEEQVSAHKVILSACSPFFRQLLRRHKHQHPLLYLRGVTFSDLESVLAFMYHGEVNIAQDQLNSFLAIAEDLKVKGLTQGKEGTQSNTERSKTPVSSSRPSQRNSNTGQSIPPVSKRPRQEPVSFQDDDIQEVVPVKTETSAVAMEEATYEEEGYEDYGSYHDQQFEVGGAGVGTGAMAMMPGGMEVTKGESPCNSCGESCVQVLYLQATSLFRTTCISLLRSVRGVTSAKSVRRFSLGDMRAGVTVRLCISQTTFSTNVNFVKRPSVARRLTSIINSTITKLFPNLLSSILVSKLTTAELLLSSDKFYFD